MILGLDVSTSITGYAITDLDGNIIEIGSWDTRNKNLYPDLFSKALFIKKQLMRMDFPIDYVFIEPALNMFMMGKSSSHTISTLIKFNGIVTWMCYEEFGILPEFIPAISARKKCGITIKRGQKAKKIVFNYFLDNEPNFIVEYTKHGNPKPQYYDQADALVMAKAGAACLKEKPGS
jgi:hypothetical protein|tara:strand:+ start:1368 stop:1898 length:531 start_codon:yes stop_codon:yes gene_type:complete